MGDPRYEILYTEAIRQLDTQQTDLDQLRSRASYLLSALGVATTFLGANLVREQHLKTLDWISLGCFVAAVILAGSLVVGSIHKWVVGFDPRFTYEQWLLTHQPPLTEDEMRVELVHRLKAGIDSNAEKLARLRLLLGLAGLAATAEIVLWIISLAHATAIKGGSP